MDIHYRSSFIIFATFFNRDLRAPTQKKEINSIVPSLPDILLVEEMIVPR